jgi:hypothetical protein
MKNLVKTNKINHLSNLPVMEPVSMPPSSNLSSSAEPVEICTMPSRALCKSDAVVKPIGINFDASASSLSALASEMPFTASSCFFVLYAIDSTVKNPASFSFFTSAAETPAP